MLCHSHHQSSPTHVNVEFITVTTCNLVCDSLFVCLGTSPVSPSSELITRFHWISDTSYSPVVMLFLSSCEVELCKYTTCMWINFNFYANLNKHDQEVYTRYRVVYHLHEWLHNFQQGSRALLVAPLLSHYPKWRGTTTRIFNWVINAKQNSVTECFWWFCTKLQWSTWVQ